MMKVITMKVNEEQNTAIPSVEKVAPTATLEVEGLSREVVEALISETRRKGRNHLAEARTLKGCDKQLAATCASDFLDFASVLENLLDSPSLQAWLVARNLNPEQDTSEAPHGR